MRSLADRIENYIKELLQVSHGCVEVQRNELAQLFACVPSQINYVLSTRFTVEQGYLVESRRGGGGYLKIIKLPLGNGEKLRRLIDASANQLTSQQVGEGLINRLLEEGFLTRREALLLQAVIRRDTLGASFPEGDLLRSRILKAVLLTILRDDFS